LFVPDVSRVNSNAGAEHDPIAGRGGKEKCNPCRLAKQKVSDTDESGTEFSVNVTLRTQTALAKDAKLDGRVGGKRSLAKSNGLRKKPNGPFAKREERPTRPNDEITISFINLSYNRWQ
jgi:hypothetical protein